ncbi:hypothetical protein CHU92_00160 [Flavobacterium cyanobacteriorum]|uniref:Uncharacterized protein n=1 Tax=Flavobacterium cyanobacteriorum TaxID=2022802 RepID=A0A256A8K9_9FLAO|nr:hypothetical protein [Flavobacterium cyanobacteriorum]OYQ50042.1 hypothetical protein CHU92_00160 [Flavobacterium cyanobacteriorum]
MMVSLNYSCKNITNSHKVNGKESGNYIEFFYMPPHEMISYRYSCEKFKSGPLPKGSEREYLKVSDEKFNLRFHSLYNSLQPSSTSNYEVDARIQLLVHRNKKVDTVCMGTAHGIIVNGSLKEDSSEFSKLVTDEIMKTYKPRFLRK